MLRKALWSGVYAGFSAAATMAARRAASDRDRRGTPDAEMNKGDQLVEQGARRLRELSAKAAARGGLAGKLAQPLAEDSAFLRKLKPSLIKARAMGEPHAEPPGAPPITPAEPETTRSSDGSGDKPNPLILVGAALGAGVATAKFLDWRGHAHPRD